MTVSSCLARSVSRIERSSATSRALRLSAASASLRSSATSRARSAAPASPASRSSASSRVWSAADFCAAARSSSSASGRCARRVRSRGRRRARLAPPRPPGPRRCALLHARRVLGSRVVERCSTQLGRLVGVSGALAVQQLLQLRGLGGRLARAALQAVAQRRPAPVAWRSRSPLSSAAQRAVRSASRSFASRLRSPVRRPRSALSSAAWRSRSAARARSRPVAQRLELGCEPLALGAQLGLELASAARARAVSLASSSSVRADEPAVGAGAAVGRATALAGHGLLLGGRHDHGSRASAAPGAPAPP